MMRCVWAKILTAGLAMLTASAAYAQRAPGLPGFGQPGGPAQMQGPTTVMLLRNDKVLEELKVTEEQKAEMKKAAELVHDKYRDDFDKARVDVDLRRVHDLRKARHQDMETALTGALQPGQVTRLKQIELHAAGIAAFSREDVLAALKLSDQQRKDVKATMQDFQEDVQDLVKDAHGDLEKMGGVYKKARALGAENVERIVASLDDGQKKAWQELTGERFDVVFHPPAVPDATSANRAPSAAALLRNDRVQAELQLTDDQKADIQKARDRVHAKYKNAFDKVWADMDLKKVTELRKALRAELDKAEVAVLRSGQFKRFNQIKVQVAGLDAFSRQDVRDALGMNDAQAKNVLDAIDKVDKELQDLVDGSQGDLEKLAAGFKQIQGRRTEMFNRTVEGLSEDQYLIWQNLTGRKFEGGFVPGMFAPPAWAW
jgi:hypothetical protein